MKKFKSPLFKILWVILFQVLFYLLFMRFPLEYLPHPAIEILVLIPFLIIIGVLWIVFLVDEIRYWLIGIPILFFLANIYTSPNASYHFNAQSGFMGDWSSVRLLFLVVFIFFIQCLLCVIKRTVKSFKK